MKLHEKLKICLLAVDSGYPESFVEINETLLGHQTFCVEACAPLEMLELLQIYAPRFLQIPACLVIDAGQSAIYLVEQSQQVPAFWVYCAGCTSLQRAKKLATSVAENGTDRKAVRTRPGEYEREAVI